MNIWNDRLVLPDNTVILPEDLECIQRIGIQSTGITWRQGRGDRICEYEWGKGYYSQFKPPRLDRCTFLADKNGVMIFERDRVMYEGKVYIVEWFKCGFWCREVDNFYHVEPLYSEKGAALFEVIGHVPYGEEEK